MVFKATKNDIGAPLVVTVRGEEKEIFYKKDGTFDCKLNTGEEFTVEYRVEDPLDRVKNRFLRVLCRILAFIFAPLVFCSENDEWVSTHNYFFKQARPFSIKKTFRVACDQEELFVDYAKPRYDKKARSYSSPDIIVEGAEAVGAKVSYEKEVMKKEFDRFYYPSCIVLLVILLGFLGLCGVLTVNTVTSESIDTLSVAGAIFCDVVMIGLFVGYAVVFVRMKRLFREIDAKLSALYLNDTNELQDPFEI
jgi:hypothetical protein